MARDMKRKNQKFKGIAINTGRASGLICLYSAERHRTVPEYSLTTDDAISQELEKFEDVLKQCSNELNRIASNVADSIGKAESEIFLTQKHIMNDPKVIAGVREQVTENRKNVEWAISDVLSAYEEKFATLDNQYLRERATDIGEIRRRLLSRLSNKKNEFVCEGQHQCSRGKDRIIVAEELTPDMLISMNVDKVLGFITEHGGTTSHAAIIARSLGIPAVSGIHGIMEFVECSDEVIIDGDTGEIFLHPDAKLLEELVPVERVLDDLVCILDTPPGMQVFANASTTEDVRHAATVGADGIGLFRTEILFIKADRLLDVNEQYVYYEEIFNIMKGKTVVFRLLDAGGDKPLPFLRIRKEANPFLGWRGARFLLGNPSIFEGQVQAIARLSLLGKIRILYPMVVDIDQMKSLLEQTELTLAKIDHIRGNIELGAMFEIPSAFFQAREILELCDFASIGSNDLIQYLFAIDRGNELVSQEYNPEHPVLWQLLKLISETARELNKPLSICGELAGREGMVRHLLDIGINSLSVSPRLVPKVRNEMARFTGALS